MRINGGSILDIGSSREQQRIKIAKQEAVAEAIRSRPGIEDASVIYDVEQDQRISAKVATAVAYVWPVGSNQLDEATVIDIRNDVVGAYAELKPENVTVSDLNGRTWRGSVGSADEIRYRSLKRTCEQELKAKILGVCTFPTSRRIAASSRRTPSAPTASAIRRHVGPRAALAMLTLLTVRRERGRPIRRRRRAETRFRPESVVPMSIGSSEIPSSRAMPKRRPTRPHSIRFASRNRRTSSDAWPRCFRGPRTPRARPTWSP